MNAIETETELQALVIGYGNPLRGDDGVGWVVAQRLAQLVDPDRVATMAVHSLTPDLAAALGHAQLVIFVDAAEDKPPGYLGSTSVCPTAQLPSMSHSLDPAALLHLTRQLYGRCPHGVLFTIGGAEFGHKEHLSDPVDRACERLITEVMRIVSRHTEPRHWIRYA
jgi:hydrogenase maturation protease